MSSFNSYLYSLGIAERFLPDEYYLQNNQLTVPNTFVLSRMKSGEILSVYSDNIWDLSPYSPKCNCRLNFDSWLENSREDDFLFCQIRAEMKKISFALLYIKSGKSIIKSIEKRHTILRQFAAIAYRNGCTLQQLFGDVAYMSKVRDAYAGVSYQKAIHIKAFLVDCFALQQQYPLLIPAFSTYKPIEHLAKLAAQLRLQSGKVGPQTKVVPSRLYIALINALADKLNEFNQYAPALLQWFQRTQQDINFALMPVEFRRAKRAISFTNARDLLGLTELFENHQIRKHANLTRYMTLIQGMAKLWIHLFTGMRDNEVNQLSYDCYQTVQSNEHLVHVLMGYTSKLHGGGNKSTYWITFEDIQIGVRAAQSIGEIYALLNSHYDLSNPAEYPLFPTLYSQKHRNKNNQNIKNETDFVSHFSGAPTRTQANFNEYLNRISALLGDELRICESDLAELESFDGFRNWREEKDCQLGEYWNICTHQFRRSLAVYGARSGIIGLGALSVQYKHLTEAMTLYYRDNAVFAPNILANDSQKEFIQELEYQRLVHSYAQFEEGVINSSSRLFGGAGTYLQLQKDREQLLKVFPDRDEAIKRMKKGEIAYKPSLFGACTNPDSCEKISFTAITSCLSCAHAIFDTESAEKMQKAVQRLQRARDTQASSSLLYGQMDSDIMALNRTIQKIKTINIEV
ncbi:hypothetical protein [Acinetobacter ursingii]|uniref:hypothetical protein n=1 Tax=Acinetobacter ursingii TaxID=108980 RepID=UPI000CAC0524|nr:hypothetical protein [Acinetobacter ursingii]MCU4305849.1 hypothetical protein [Acinetobacter ursingii]MCU4372594.1 hypothetical protein [Acinetobacter ursingii]MDI3236664.1 hypothetical protein [Acinetobacter ursingii]PMC97958.1 hypothetical protein CJ183_05045 [Acinetobacter ursingii]